MTTTLLRYDVSHALLCLPVHHYHHHRHHHHHHHRQFLNRNYKSNDPVNQTKITRTQWLYKNLFILQWCKCKKKLF